MIESRRIPTAHVEIDGRDFVLSGDRDLAHVMVQIVAAAASPPAFVDLSDGDQLISVLIRPTTRVIVTVTYESDPDADLVPILNPIGDWEM